MLLKAIALSAALWLSITGSALAAPGPQEACQAISEHTREAVTLKKQGMAVDEAVAQFSALPVPGSVPSAQRGFYQSKLPPAIKFAYMAGMSGKGIAAFYLKQCLQGS